MSNTLVGSATLRFNRHRLDRYEQLHERSSGEDGGQWGPHFQRKGLSLMTQNHTMIMTPLGYKRDRARKRHIFLQSYKLSLVDHSRKKWSSSRELKKATFRFKKVVVSILAFIRTTTSLNSCKSGSVSSASSPSRT